VTMSNNPNNFIIGLVGADTLTNQETIQGSGNIGDGRMTLVNSKTINANGSFGLTIQANGGTTNTGTLEATNGSTLTLNGTTVTNTGGTISANGSGLVVTNSTINGGAVTLTGASTLRLVNGTIHSGSTLTNSSTGLIETSSNTFNNTLGGTIVNPAGGVIQISNDSTLNLENGSYPNLGAVTLNSGGFNTVLSVNGASAILSGGSVTMSNNPNNFIIGLVGADTLTNQETIQGSGNIGDGRMTLVNSGSIIANHPNTLFIDTSGSFTNNGTLQVNSPDFMHVEGGTFTNFSGSTLTGGIYNVSGTLEIDQLGKTGGEIVTNAANIILNGTGSSFFDAAGLNALSNLNANSTPTSSFTITGGRNFTTTGNFTNKGTLTVGGTSKFGVKGNLTNLSGTTLSGGTYNISGTLQYGNTSDIATNSATITLTGAGAQIIDASSHNALGGLSSNSSAGNFTVTGGQVLSDTATAFSNAGTLTVGKSSGLDLTGATATYTQTAGTTTVDGTLTAKGGITLSGGSVFGNGGTLVGNTTNKGTTTFNVGDAIKTAGTEAITGTYTQTTGALDIDIGGTTVGTQLDRLTISSAASLNGTLNLDLINSFVPTVGETFDILNASKVTGTFSTVTGTAINSSEHFTVVYSPTNVTLDVVSGASPHSGFASHDSPTPEPSTLLLLGSGLLLMAHFARRRAGGKGGWSSKD